MPAAFCLGPIIVSTDGLSSKWRSVNSKKTKPKNDKKKPGNRGKFRGKRLELLQEWLPEYIHRNEGGKKAKRGSGKSFWDEFLPVYWKSFPWRLDLNEEPPDDAEALEELGRPAESDEEKKTRQQRMDSVEQSLGWWFPRQKTTTARPNPFQPMLKGLRTPTARKPHVVSDHQYYMRHEDFKAKVQERFVAAELLEEEDDEVKDRVRQEARAEHEALLEGYNVAALGEPSEDPEDQADARSQLPATVQPLLDGLENAESELATSGERERTETPSQVQSRDDDDNNPLDIQELLSGVSTWGGADRALAPRRGKRKANTDEDDESDSDEDDDEEDVEMVEVGEGDEGQEAARKEKAKPVRKRRKVQRRVDTKARPTERDDWFEPAKRYLEIAKGPPCWTEALTKWEAYEEAAGFLRSTATHDTSKRPAQVHLWVKNDRRGDYDPGISNFGAFGVQVESWWVDINPDWRSRSREGSWEAVDVPGRNGFLNFFVCLKWWYEASRGQTRVRVVGDGMSEQDVRKKFEAEHVAEIAAGTKTQIHDVSPLVFVTLGLDIEEMQRKVRVHAELERARSAAATVNVVDLRRELNRSLQRLRTLQATYTPGALVQLATIDIPQDALPKDIPPLLPSALTQVHRASCVSDVVVLEKSLREAQCRTAHVHLCNQLHVKAGLLIYKQHQSRHQGMNTRSRNLINTNESKIKLQADKYQTSQRALRALVGREPPGFPELRKSDIRCMDDATSSIVATGVQRQKNVRRAQREVQLIAEGDMPLYRLGDGDEDKDGMDSDDTGDDKTTGDKATGESRRTMSWIWAGAGGTGTDSEVLEALQIEWSKTYARVRRWREEVPLLDEESRRYPVSLEFEIGKWERRAEQVADLPDSMLAEGKVAYALKQQALYRDLIRRGEMTMTEKKLKGTRAEEAGGNDGHLRQTLR
ncbi:hypothetical protein MKEN_00487200 [Mycena kentingensis (nom. inval.)]|nr:hypothetical protein MKEN_00487200 [Mycena kentingensis (nom. inval.)]